MAEHGLEGPVLGLAWDGTGYGTDGTAWGGELLRVTAGSCERLATLRPLRLAGGDEAIRQVWRLALAVLDDAFDGQPPLERLGLFAALPARDVAVVRRMLQTGLRSPLAHGAGRYFDALGAIGLGRARASYEGQVALEWNLAAADGAVRAYPFELGVVNGLVEADLRPLVRAAVTDVVDGVTPARVSAAFHEALCDVADAQVRGAAAHCGRLPVVLSGGCFQNARLAEGVRRRLAGDFECVHARRGAAGGRRDRARPGARGGRSGRRPRGALSMCLAVPGKVVEITGDGELRMGRVDFSGVTRQACLAYVPEVRIGDYVLVHVGFALSRIDEQAAMETLRTLAEIGALDPASEGEP